MKVLFILQRVEQKELPHYIGYLRKALKTASNMLIGDELRGFSLKVSCHEDCCIVGCHGDCCSCYCHCTGDLFF